MTFSFGGRLTKVFPSQVIIDVTEVCNLACGHCPHPVFKQSKHYGARFLDPKLNMKAVAEVREHGAQFIRYCAEGEPLIHPKCYVMIAVAVENSQTFVTLTTNGTLLDERSMKELIWSGLHMIDVSIDAASEETYAAVRGGDYEEVVSNVRRMASMKGARKLVVSFIEQEKNCHEVEAFRQLWTGVADEVVVRRLHTAAGHLSRASAQDGRYPCVYPWERIVLNPAGKLKFCPQEWFAGSEIADYHDTTIKEVWASPAYEDLRQAHLTGKCKGVCEKCPDWKQTRWPHQAGGSYGELVEEMAA